MTRRWVESLPDASKPWQLMFAYPRLANRIAGAWPDEGEALTVLNDLILDRRGNRRGFSPFVLTELLSLHALAQRR